MLILTVSGLKVLGPVLAQGPVSRLTVNNPNVNKCKVLDFGYRNIHSIYSLGAEVRKEADEERKRLGVIINRSLKSSSQCVSVAKAANRTLGRTFVNRHTEILL